MAIKISGIEDLKPDLAVDRVAKRRSAPVRGNTPGSFLTCRLSPISRSHFLQERLPRTFLLLPFWLEYQMREVLSLADSTMLVHVLC